MSRDAKWTIVKLPITHIHTHTCAYTHTHREHVKGHGAARICLCCRLRTNWTISGGQNILTRTFLRRTSYILMYVNRRRQYAKSCTARWHDKDHIILYGVFIRVHSNVFHTQKYVPMYYNKKTWIERTSALNTNYAQTSGTYSEACSNRIWRFHLS